MYAVWQSTIYTYRSESIIDVAPQDLKDGKRATQRDGPKGRVAIFHLSTPRRAIGTINTTI